MVIRSSGRGKLESAEENKVLTAFVRSFKDLPNVSDVIFNKVRRSIKIRTLTYCHGGELPQSTW
jgi:hypothetical protein